MRSVWLGEYAGPEAGYRKNQVGMRKVENEIWFGVVSVRISPWVGPFVFVSRSWGAGPVFEGLLCEV